MKTLSESMKEIDSKKRQLEQQVDHLNEECAKLNAKGSYYFWHSASTLLHKLLIYFANLKVFVRLLSENRIL